MKKEAFLKVIDTLKLYRRAELVDELGDQLISELYVDPLPDNHILRTILKPNTTFLIGRKGTGKSTIFQRAQESLNSDRLSTWAYIDIKTLYESSTSEIIGDVPSEFESTLSPEAIHRLIIFKSFVIELIQEIKKQIQLRVTSTFWSKAREAFTGSVFELFEKLDEYVEELKADQFFDATGSMLSAKLDEDTCKDSGKIAAEASAKIAASPSLQAKIFTELFSSFEQKRSQNYSQIFIRVFNIRGLISRLREILTILKIKHLYIFIDDFSELPQNDMEQVVDTILAPFNNWSDEFIKLKVAV